MVLVVMLMLMLLPQRFAKKNGRSEARQLARRCQSIGVGEVRGY